MGDPFFSSQSITPPETPDARYNSLFVKPDSYSLSKSSGSQDSNTHKKRPSLERSFTPSYHSLTREVTTLDVAHKKIRKITCLGSGFVGGPTSAVTAFKSDVEVTVVDINPKRINEWNSDVLPIYEPGLQDIVLAARDGIDSKATSQHNGNEGQIGQGSRRRNLVFSTNADKAIASADLIFVCVNTPTKSNGIGKGSAADLGFVEAATRHIAEIATENKIIVEKSTVPCRTAQSIREILSANARSGVHFDVLSNPEFLAEGTAIRDLLYPDRIIIGSMSSPAGYRAAASLADVYAQWVPRERIITMNLWSSELSKLAANALLAQRISSVNALSAICEATGADVDEVSYACGLDSRIGPGMLKAGPGFGGSCFQKDIFNIVYLSESLHLYEVADYWRGIINMNEHQKHRFTKRIISCLFNTLTGKKIAVLGFAFKKDTSDTRESPAITLVTNFVAEKARVTIYDPKVKEDQIWLDLVNEGGDMDTLKRHIEVCQSAYQACEAADAVVVVTEWDEFSNKSKAKTIDKDDITVLTEIDPNRTPTAKKMPTGKPSSLFVSPQYIMSPVSESRMSTFEKQEKFSLMASQSPIIGNSRQDTTVVNSLCGPPAIQKKSMQENGETATKRSQDENERGERYRRTPTKPKMERLGLTHDHGVQNDVGVEKEGDARLDWARIAARMRKPMFVFDGRNILDATKLERMGFRVEAIGRASKKPQDLGNYE